MSADESLKKQQFLEGVTIFSAGDLAAEAFLIENGAVEIKKDEQIIATLGPGDIFGEMALIKSTVHSSTAVAAADKTNLVVISKETLFKKLEEADPLIAALIHMFVKRLYKTNEALKNSL